MVGQQRKERKLRFTYEEIKKELKEHLDELDREDLTEWADSFVPVYYNEIIKDWQEMPSEFDNGWKELSSEMTYETTITSLMAQDLFLYYLSQCETAFRELTEEAEEASNN